MRVPKFLAFFVFFSAVSSSVFAEPGPGLDEFKIGPIPVNQEFQGTKVTTPITMYLNIKVSPEKIIFGSRAYADLSDVQTKISNILQSAPLPRDNCETYSSENIVAEIKDAKLSGLGDRAVLTIKGRAEVWQCYENITQDVKIEWRVKKICCGIKTKVPTRVTVSRSSPIKNKLLSQSFTANIPIRIVRPTPDTIGIEADRLEIELSGDFAKLLQQGLFYGGFDLNEFGQKMINKVLRVNVITLLVPQDFKIFNPALDRAVFMTDDGRLKIEAVMSGRLDAGAVLPVNLKALSDPQNAP